jgi:hypothetical protein
MYASVTRLENFYAMGAGPGANASYESNGTRPGAHRGKHHACNNNSPYALIVGLEKLG